MARKKYAKLDADTLFEFGKAEQVQQSQLFDAKYEAREIREGLDTLDQMQSKSLDDSNSLITDLEELLKTVESQKLSDSAAKSIDSYFDDYAKSVKELTPSAQYDMRRTKEIITNNNWESYYDRVNAYADEIGIDDSEDPFLSLLGESEYRKLKDEINDEFARKTSIRNKTDLKFLAVAIALEVAKGLLYPLISQKLGYGDSFNPDDRLDHNDPSIEKAKKEAIDKYQNKKLKNHSTGEWMEILHRTVPYDITKGTGNMPDINLHGGSHRLYTLGHDPILGWIFGTANILTDVITVSPGAVVQSDNKWAELIKVAGIRSYKVQRKPSMMILPERVSTFKMFKDSFDVIREDPLNLPTAVFVEGQHLKSDVNTKMGLPVPVLETFAPDFASKLYEDNYDALCFARDAKIVGLSAVISILMDMLIGLIHGMYYNPSKDGSRDLYEVRTRKILLIANTIGTSSNLIFSFCTQNIKALDIGGLLITLSHLFMDTRFICNVKKEFLENKIYESIDKEIQELDEIEIQLSEYGEKHRVLYD